MNTNTQCYWSGFMGAWIVASAIVAWSLVSATAVSSAPTVSASDHSSAVPLTISNAARKGDRLIAQHRDGASGARSEPAGTKYIVKIPVGCDPAFSRLIKSGNLVARCVTSIAPSARVA